ncbi:cobalamin biosynthesis protein CbiX [Escherichia coli]
MKLTNYLAKFFDVYVEMDTDLALNGTEEVEHIWLFENGDDCEPLLILIDVTGSLVPAADGKTYRVGNIYSTLQHGQLLTEKEVKNAAKKGGIKSKF